MRDVSPGGSLLEEDDVDSCSQLPPPMSCCIPSTSLLSVKSSTDGTSASCHTTQHTDAGTPSQQAARPTTLLVTYLLLLSFGLRKLTINYAINVQEILSIHKACNYFLLRSVTYIVSCLQQNTFTINVISFEFILLNMNKLGFFWF